MHFGSAWPLLGLPDFAAALSLWEFMQKTKEQLLGRWHSPGLREGTRLERYVFIGDRKCFSSNYLIFLGTRTFEHSPNPGGNTGTPVLVSALSQTRHATLGKSSGLHFTSFACWDNTVPISSVGFWWWENDVVWRYLEIVKSGFTVSCYEYYVFLFFFFFFLSQLWFTLLVLHSHFLP